MGELGIQIGPILAAAGVLGLAIGFGARNLVEDIISGFFIFLENQIRRQDFLKKKWLSFHSIQNPRLFGTNCQVPSVDMLNHYLLENDKFHHRW